MKFLKEHRQSIGIITMFILLIILEIVLYLNYGIKLDSYSGYLAALAAFLGVIISSDSISSWGNKQKAIQEDISTKRKEQINDKKIKLAADIMTACYQLEQSILKISNPFTYSDETKKAQEEMEKNTDIPEKSKKQIETGLVFRHRLEDELTTINNFMSLKIPARIYFGEQLSILFDKTKKYISKEIYVNIQMLLSGESNLRNKEEPYSTRIWNLSIQDNFMKKLIPEFEKILLPLLRDDS